MLRLLIRLMVASLLNVDSISEATQKKAKKANEGQVKAKKAEEDQKKVISAEVSSAMPLQPQFDDATYQGLGKPCQQLHDSLQNLPTNVPFHLELLDSDPFHSGDVGMHVFIDDIKDLLRMHRLTQTILKIFAMYLHKLCVDSSIESIGFICPDRISEKMCEKPESITYMTTAMQRQSTKFILAPYFEREHWVLLIICPQLNTVYFLDPLGNPNSDRFAVKNFLNMAFGNCGMNGGVRREGDMCWKPLTCPPQLGNNDCGYYVMRYMLDIVRKYHDQVSFDKVSLGEELYTKEEIDEVRDDWAKHFASLRR